MLVANNADLFGPLSIRNPAETKKQKARLDGSLLPGLEIADGDGAQHVVAIQGDDLGFGHDLDIRGMGDAIDEIFGDVVVEALAAHDDGDLAGVAGKMQRGLG